MNEDGRIDLHFASDDDDPKKRLLRSACFNLVPVRYQTRQAGLGWSVISQRIQLRRTKGWRMPANTVAVTRPGPWGNPFRVGDSFRLTASGWEKASRPSEKGFTRIVDHAMAVEWFARWMEAQRPDVAALRGKNLACWCKAGLPCHADVLLEWANRGSAR